MWTRKAEEQKGKAVKQGKSVRVAAAAPTPTHMAMVELQRRGLLKYVISQNIDGLHRKSGIPPSAISELHGNTNREICNKCGKEYLRDYRVRNNKHVHSHETGRKCACGGDLCDTIINFGENLPVGELNLGYYHSTKADLCLAMGSSLRVTPAADLPAITGKKHRLVIVNLQRTPLDDIAAMRINGKCDDVMKRLMTKLAMPIPPFHLVRHLKVLHQIQNGKLTLSIGGFEVDGSPYELLKGATVELPSSIRIAGSAPSHQLQKDPMSLKSLPINPPTSYNDAKSLSIAIKAQFMGHYQEPELKIAYPLTAASASVVFRITYQPQTGKYVDDTPKIVVPAAGDKTESKSEPVIAPTASSSSSSSVDELVREMMSMGFTQAQSTSALKQAKNNVFAAVAALASVEYDD